MTVVLPVTTDCALRGAICTGDGKKLSKRLEFAFDGPVVSSPNSAATGAPTIGGTAQVGQTLTASTSGITDSDGLSNATFAYQWLSSDGTNDSDISGATSSAYTLVETDEGKTVKVRVSFTDDADNAETLTSGATAAVAAARSPLTVSLTGGAPTTHDGSAIFTFEMRFSEENQSELQDTPVTCLHRDGRLHPEGATNEQTQQHPVADYGAAGLQWRHRDSTPGDLGLRGHRGHMHGGWQNAVQPTGVDGPGSGTVAPSIFSCPGKNGNQSASIVQQ